MPDDDNISSGFYARPSELKAKLEAKIQAESRSDDVKAKEFKQAASDPSRSRAQQLNDSNRAFATSSVKAKWESRIRQEGRADDLKAREFSEGTGWSSRRAEDVPRFAAHQPTEVKERVEERVREESKPDDAKARSYLRETKDVDHGPEVPRILVGPDHVKGGIEARAEYERASADEKARNFLEETTYLGVQRREFKSALIPLSVLFAKPHKDQVRISPKGTYLVWRSRGRSMGDPKREDNGVMNFFAKSMETSKIRQITFYDEMDACVHFQITPDDRSIVFLRETKRGSENYHLFAIELDPFFDQEDVEVDDPSVPPPIRPRELIEDPEVTCGMGFVGGIQLWTSSESTPREVYVSTARIGPLAMCWDVSRVDIDTAEVAIVEWNIMSTKWGMIRVAILTFIARVLSLCCIKVRPPGVPIQWFPDEELKFRGRIEVTMHDLGASFCARARDSANKWNRLHSAAFEDMNFDLVGSTGGSGTARMEFNGPDQVDIHLCAFKTGGKKSDTTTYDRFNVRTGQYLKRIAGGNAKSDITGFVSHPKTGKAQFVYYEYEKTVLEVIPKAETFDHSRLQGDIEYIRSHFPSTATFRLISQENSDTKWILYVENDVGHSMFKDSPSAYFLFTRAATVDRGANNTSVEVKRNIELIFPSRPEMKKYQLARMDPVHVKARDGEDIVCYLSRIPPLPTIKGRAEEPAGPPPPLVVVIHGGPQARDSWGYNPLCQFLCSRGFRVLQVNYRGSTGFGARFTRLGMNGEFYKSLQDDIADAVKHATSSPEKKNQYADVDMPPLPWGDPTQLAILGGSFGGYSSLWQMTSNPGLYRCAIAICPISSVGAADDQSKTSFGGSPLIARYWQRVFGKNISKNKIAARKASPMYHIGKVRPGSTVALYHGENDPRAPIRHSYRVLEQLKKCGIAGECVAFAGEGHSISRDANKLYMYYRIEEVLCRMFGIDVFDAGDSEKIESNTATVKWSAQYAPEKSDV